MSTDLIKAVMDSDAAKVKKLLESENLYGDQPIDVNYQDERYGNTALHYAMHLNNMAIAELLLDNGANLRVKNFKGDDPMETFLNITTYRKII